MKKINYEYRHEVYRKPKVEDSLEPSEEQSIEDPVGHLIYFRKDQKDFLDNYSKNYKIYTSTLIRGLLDHYMEKVRKAMKEMEF